MDHILVCVTKPADNQVVLWERHPGHPNGEVFLAGNREFTVAKTPAVEARLRDGRLAIVQRSSKGASTAKSGEADPAETGDADPAESRKGSRTRNRSDE